MMAHICNPCTWEVETGGLGDLGLHPYLHNEIKGLHETLFKTTRTHIYKIIL